MHSREPTDQRFLHFGAFVWVPLKVPVALKYRIVASFESTNKTIVLHSRRPTSKSSNVLHSS